MMIPGLVAPRVWHIAKALRGTCVRIDPRRYNTSNSAAYDGDGKTTVSVLNNEEKRLHLINTYSSKGFRLSNELFVAGSIILFPTNVFSWNVKRGADINLDSLILFDLIVPKIKILVIGYGQMGEKYDPTLSVELKKKGISCELLPTPNAVTTYNYLVHDGLHAAGAFIPVIEEVVMTEKDASALRYTEVFEDYPDYTSPMDKRLKFDIIKKAQKPRKDR